MENNLNAFMASGTFTLIILFLLVLTILWFLLPFAVFGIKSKMNNLTSELEKTNEALNKILLNMQGEEVIPDKKERIEPVINSVKEKPKTKQPSINDLSIY